MTFDREEGEGGTDETAGKLSLLDWASKFYPVLEGLIGMYCVRPTERLGMKLRQAQTRLLHLRFSPPSIYNLPVSPVL